MSNFSSHTAIGILEDEYDIQRVKRIPMADVVEVVRCKDCKKSTKNTTGEAVPLFCEMLKCAVFFHNYCYWGERKDDE